MWYWNRTSKVKEIRNFWSYLEIEFKLEAVVPGWVFHLVCLLLCNLRSSLDDLLGDLTVTLEAVEVATGVIQNESRSSVAVSSDQLIG